VVSSYGKLVFDSLLILLLQLIGIDLPARDVRQVLLAKHLYLLKGTREVQTPLNQLLSSKPLSDVDFASRFVLLIFFF
jgi:hypothetical protein